MPTMSMSASGGKADMTVDTVQCPLLTQSRHWFASKAAVMRHDAVYGAPPFLLGLATSSGAASNGLVVSWHSVCRTALREAHTHHLGRASSLQRGVSRRRKGDPVLPRRCNGRV